MELSERRFWHVCYLSAAFCALLLLAMYVTRVDEYDEKVQRMSRDHATVNQAFAGDLRLIRDRLERKP